MAIPSMKIARLLVLCLVATQALIAQEAATPSPYKGVTDKLESMSKVALTDCRWHSDVPHPEDASVDDSTWKPIKVGAVFTSGVQVFRCWYTVPQKLSGYEIRDASLKVAFELQGDGMTMLSVYSNNFSVYRGTSDTLEPILLTSKVQPGDRFLIAMRLEVGDQRGLGRAGNCQTPISMSAVSPQLTMRPVRQPTRSRTAAVGNPLAGTNS